MAILNQPGEKAAILDAFFRNLQTKHLTGRQMSGHMADNTSYTMNIYREGLQAVTSDLGMDVETNNVDKMADELGRVPAALAINRIALDHFDEMRRKVGIMNEIRDSILDYDKLASKTTDYWL